MVSTIPTRPGKGTSLSPKWILEGHKDALERARRAKGLGSKDMSMPTVERTCKGTDATLSGTKEELERRWEDMKKFFLLVGDYTSALLVDREECPKRPHPLKPVSLREYASYMAKPEGTLLGIPNRMGAPIYSIGVWNAPNNLQKFQSAVSSLHNLYPHLRQEYVPACSECIQLTRLQAKENQYTCCKIHTGGAHLVPTGNVVKDPSVYNHIRGLRHDLARKHNVRGNVQLTPHEVRQLRTFVLSESLGSARKNELEGLKFYTMVILGIKLFLRSDELLSIQVRDFVNDLTKVYAEEGVTDLVIQIQGKSDKQPVHLVVRRDTEFPEFCPVRHLLLYMYLSGIKSGYIFPPAHSAIPYGTGVSDQKYPYEVFLGQLKELCTEKLNRSPQESIYGTHVLRKTGYLFAIWGVLKVQGKVVDSRTNRATVEDLSMGAILRSARHVSIQNASCYSMDSITLYEWSSSSRLRENMEVAVWRDIHIEVTDPFRATIVECRHLQKALPYLSEWYVHTYLGLPEDREKHTIPIHEYLRVMLGKKASQKKEELLCLLTTKINGFPCTQEEREEFMELINSLACETRRAETRSPGNLKHLPPHEVNNGEDAPSTGMKVTIEESVAIPSQRKNKKRKYGDDDLESRKNLKNFGPSERVNTILGMVGKIGPGEGQQAPSTLTNAAGKWLYAVGKPVAKCYENCHKEDLRSFLEAMGKATLLKKYKCPRCMERNNN